ncbi:MAG: hypothetical protein HXY44_12970 [Syntrophaceae bacterium]|nr:hypothetical protein [Syntrophaceae bacterium]
MRGVKSSGRESFVFRANRPEGLLGVHSDLMEMSLRPNEALLYLLYAPIWPEKKGPFGLHATPGSHAVAVTRGRFIISENQHREGILPTVQSIPFDRVLYIRLGTALSLGWFGIQFIEEKKTFSKTLFFTATGIAHFQSLIREYRRNNITNGDRFPKKIDWVDVWQRTPMTQVDRLKSLLIEGEFPFSTLRSSEAWALRRKGWRNIPVYLSTNGILISSSLGFIHATDEPCIRPKMFSFGVNVSCIAFDALKSAQILERKMHGKGLSFLRMELSRENVMIDFDIPFDGSSFEDAENLVYFLSERRKTGRKACIL